MNLKRKIISLSFAALALQTPSVAHADIFNTSIWGMIRSFFSAPVAAPQPPQQQVAQRPASVSPPRQATRVADPDVVLSVENPRFDPLPVPPGFKNDSKVPKKEDAAYRWPVGGEVVSAFGARDLEGFKDKNGHVHKGSSEHSGIDLRAPVGTPVAAANGGRIAWVSPDCKKSYGQMLEEKADGKASAAGCSVAVVSDNGNYSFYAHLSSLDKQYMNKGASIDAGSTLGKSGASGQGAEGPHVHFTTGRVKDPDAVIGVAPTKVFNSKMGVKTNPVDVLDQSDPRVLRTKKLEKARDLYVACRKNASTSSEKELCRTQKKQGKFTKEAADYYKAKADDVSKKSLIKGSVSLE